MPLKDSVADRFRDLRNDGVSETFEAMDFGDSRGLSRVWGTFNGYSVNAVHESGNPINHSTNVGFREPPTGEN